MIASPAFVRPSAAVGTLPERSDMAHVLLRRPEHVAVEDFGEPGMLVETEICDVFLNMEIDLIYEFIV